MSHLLDHSQVWIRNTRSQKYPLSFPHGFSGQYSTTFNSTFTESWKRQCLRPELNLHSKMKYQNCKKQLILLYLGTCAKYINLRNIFKTAFLPFFSF